MRKRHPIARLAVHASLRCNKTAVRPAQQVIMEIAQPLISGLKYETDEKRPEKKKC